MKPVINKRNTSLLTRLELVYSLIWGAHQNWHPHDKIPSSQGNNLWKFGALNGVMGRFKHGNFSFSKGLRQGLGKGLSMGSGFGQRFRVGFRQGFNQKFGQGFGKGLGKGSGRIQAMVWARVSTGCSEDLFTVFNKCMSFS